MNSLLTYVPDNDNWNTISFSVYKGKGRYSFDTNSAVEVEHGKRL